MNIQDIKKHILSSGPQTSIIGRDSYRIASVIIPFIEINGVPHLLFEQRAGEIVQGGEICFPGGVFETDKDTTTADTAIRETCEELGLEKRHIELHGFFGTVIALRGVLVDCYCATLNIGSIEECYIDSNEVAHLFTLPVDYFIKNPPQQYPLRTEVSPYVIEHDGSVITLFPAKKLGLPEKYHHPWGSRDHRVLLYPTEHGQVWGLTGEIVYELVLRLHQA